MGEGGPATAQNVRNWRGYFTLAEKLLWNGLSTVGKVEPMQAKKKTQHDPAVRPEAPKPVARPEGMQTMGPTLYEQIRRIVGELKLVSDN